MLSEAKKLEIFVDRTIAKLEELNKVIAHNNHKVASDPESINWSEFSANIAYISTQHANLSKQLAQVKAHAELNMEGFETTLPGVNMQGKSNGFKAANIQQDFSPDS